MFVEDGIEMYNTFSNNVVSLVHRSFSLLNTDQTQLVFGSRMQTIVLLEIACRRVTSLDFGTINLSVQLVHVLTLGPLELSTFDTRKRLSFNLRITLFTRAEVTGFG